MVDVIKLRVKEVEMLVIFIEKEKTKLPLTLLGKLEEKWAVTLKVWEQEIL